MSGFDRMLGLDLVLLGLGLVLAFVRVAKGPTLPDRVVALDLLSTIAAGVIVLTAIRAGRGLLLDVALILMLVSFLGTVSIAHYIERRSAP